MKLKPLNYMIDTARDLRKSHDYISKEFITDEHYTRIVFKHREHKETKYPDWADAIECDTHLDFYLECCI